MVHLVRTRVYPAGVTATRWQTIWEWPLTVAAMVFLIVYAWQVLDELQGPASDAADVILTITWVMFAIDYVARLVLAQRRWSWFGRHLLDLAIVALPILRPLRLVRLVVLLAIFQRVAGRTLRGRVVVYIAGSTILLVFVTALAVLDAERHEPGASIQTFGDALWWAFATITTVGYGDVTPISLTGRAIAVVLMIGGIALLGTVTATLASWIVQRVAEEDVANQASTRRQVEMLTQKLEQMQLRPEWARPPVKPRRRSGPRVAPRARVERSH